MPATGRKRNAFRQQRAAKCKPLSAFLSQGAHCGVKGVANDKSGPQAAFGDRPHDRALVFVNREFSYRRPHRPDSCRFRAEPADSPDCSGTAMRVRREAAWARRRRAFRWLAQADSPCGLHSDLSLAESLTLLLQVRAIDC